MFKKIIERYVRFFGGDKLLAGAVGAVVLTFVIGLAGIAWVVHTGQNDDSQYMAFVRILKTHKQEGVTLELNKETITIYLKNGERYTFPSHFIVDSGYHSSIVNNNTDGTGDKPLSLHTYLFLRFIGF